MMNSLIRTIVIMLVLVSSIAAEVLRKHSVIASEEVYREPISYLRKETRALVESYDDPGLFFQSVGEDLTCSPNDQLLFQDKPFSQKDCFNLCRNTPGCSFFASNLPPTKELAKLGNNGSPFDVFPLGECEGDCDVDSDCQPGLFCFQRNDKTPVPGCTGEGQNGKDYCYDPNTPGLPKLVEVGNNGSPADAFPLGVCEGDCDRDKDCRPGLKCFQRNGREPVPGCAGVGGSGKDYCYFPDFSASTRMLVAADPAPEPATGPKKLVRLGNNGSPADVFPLGECEGDCDTNNDCQPGLTCFQRSGFEEVPGCSGAADIQQGTDVCFKAPTASPSAAPSLSPPGSLPKLVKLGNNGSPSDVFPLGLCEGDCDGDSECQPGLKCFQRNGKEEVPGCRGEENNSGTDFCYDPGSTSPSAAPSLTPPGSLPKLVYLGESSANFPLGECEGDCDKDSNCEPGLKCFKRNGNEVVPGCRGEEKNAGRDFCYDPGSTSPSAAPSLTPPGSLPKLVLLGDEDDLEIFPLGVCEADCDKDSDCEPGLKCFQRIGKEEVPGCKGEGVAGRDYCYDPGTSSPSAAPSLAPVTCFLCQSDNNLEPLVGFDIFEIVEATFAPTITPPPKVCEASAWGDPHIVTWDGLKFDAQPKGDAVFLTDSASSLEIQGRLEKLGSSGGPAVITGITAKGSDDSSPVIQVSVADPDIVALAEGGFTDVSAGSQGFCPIEVIVDGQTQQGIAYNSSDGVSVTQDGLIITIEYPSTLTIEMELRLNKRCYFSVDFFLFDCESYEESVIGLLGSPNDNSTDDWMTPEGEVLPLPEGVSQFFFEDAFIYVQDNWIISNENDSLFNYDGDLVTFEEYSDPEEEYDNTIELLVGNPDPEIAEICQGNLQCLIDGEELGTEGAEDFITNPAADRVTVEEEIKEEEEESEDDNAAPEEEESADDNPTTSPTLSPTGIPIPTLSPTEVPTTFPTLSPTGNPTAFPTLSPTGSPTTFPTLSPTGNPTAFPTLSPTGNPTAFPTLSPTGNPTAFPTLSPTGNPTAFPTSSPTAKASSVPSASPTKSPVVVDQFDKLEEDDTDDLIFSPIGPEQCPDDILLVKQTGLTPYPDDSVRIISQDMTTVTVELVQMFTESSIALDSVFYQYRDSTFHSTCPEVENFFGEDSVELQIQCTFTTKSAFLEIWVADNIEKGVLSEGDNAVVPKCCHPTLPEETPVTMYFLEIKCDSQCPEVFE